MSATRCVLCGRYLTESQRQLGVRNGELSALARSKAAASDEGGGRDRVGKDADVVTVQRLLLTAAACPVEEELRAQVRALSLSLSAMEVEQQQWKMTQQRLQQLVAGLGRETEQVRATQLVEADVAAQIQQTLHEQVRRRFSTNPP